MKYNLDWLLNQQKEKKELDYLFFWGHKPTKDNSITKSCFSQWWPSAFMVDGIEYKTAEHWMMAKKALLFNDIEIHDKIIRTVNPANVKKLGREIKNFDTAIWGQYAFDIVVKGNSYKFSQHESLKEFMLQTGNAILVEASPVDRIWGIGMTQDNLDINNPAKWRGSNLLGFALMEVRDLLRI